MHIYHFEHIKLTKNTKKFHKMRPSNFLQHPLAYKIFNLTCKKHERGIKNQFKFALVYNKQTCEAIRRWEHVRTSIRSAGEFNLYFLMGV